MAKGPLLFQSDQEIELYRKQTEVELARLPLRRFENEATQARLPTYALWAIVMFGAVAFLMQFINTLPNDEKSWGRNFLMVVVGGLVLKQA